MHVPFRRAVFGPAVLSLVMLFSSACASLPHKEKPDLPQCIRNNETGHPQLYALEFPHRLCKKPEPMPEFRIPLPEEGITIETQNSGTLIIKLPEDIDTEKMTEAEILEVASRMVPQYELPKNRRVFATGDGIFYEVETPASNENREDERSFFYDGRLFQNILAATPDIPRNTESPPIPCSKKAAIIMHFDADGICHYEVVRMKNLQKNSAGPPDFGL